MFDSILYVQRKQNSKCSFRIPRNHEIFVKKQFYVCLLPEKLKIANLFLPYKNKNKFRITNFAISTTYFDLLKDKITLATQLLEHHSCDENINYSSKFVRNSHCVSFSRVEYANRATVYIFNQSV